MLTDLGDGCFNVDYYGDAVAGRLVEEPRARLDASALDPGVFCGTADSPPGDARRSDRERRDDPLPNP